MLHLLWFHGKNYLFLIKKTPASYVLPANNHEAPCLGQEDIHVKMGCVLVIISNVLHIPLLRCPLYSVQCHSRIPGCAFHTDNKGIILAFPTFILPVDTSYDCAMKGIFQSPSDTVYFDQCSLGNTMAVSDHTRYRASRRGAVHSPVDNCHVSPDTSPVSASTYRSSTCDPICDADTIDDPISSLLTDENDIDDDSRTSTDTSPDTVSKLFDDMGIEWSFF